MDVLILIAVLLAAAIYVARPLYAPGSESAPPPGGPLVARRDALLQMLRDLEQDHRSGLIDDAEFVRQRDATEAEAADVMRALDRSRRPGPVTHSD